MRLKSAKKKNEHQDGFDCRYFVQGFDRTSSKVIQGFIWDFIHSFINQLILAIRLECFRNPLKKKNSLQN